MLCVRKIRAYNPELFSEILLNRIFLVPKSIDHMYYSLVKPVHGLTRMPSNKPDIFLDIVSVPYGRIIENMLGSGF